MAASGVGRIYALGPGRILQHRGERYVEARRTSNRSTAYMRHSMLLSCTSQVVYAIFPLDVTVLDKSLEGGQG